MILIKQNFSLLVLVYQVEEVNLLLMHIEYIFLHNFVYDILSLRLMQDFFDLQFREYILVYSKLFHKLH
jgi:hypothetical protein